MELTELDVDLRPRRFADERRMEECGVRVCGLRLWRFRAVLELLATVLLVFTRGLAGSVARVCNSGRWPMLALRCCCSVIFPVAVRFS